MIVKAERGAHEDGAHSVPVEDAEFAVVGGCERWVGIYSDDVMAISCGPLSART